LPQFRIFYFFARKDASLDLLFLFYQEKRKSLLAAVSRGKVVHGEKTANTFSLDKEYTYLILLKSKIYVTASNV